MEKPTPITQEYVNYLASLSEKEDVSELVSTFTQDEKDHIRKLTKTETFATFLKDYYNQELLAMYSLMFSENGSEEG